MSANVLIVDDKPSMRATLSSHLELAGYTIETAPDGQVAMEILRQREFELVLSDIRMPNMGGLELLRAARQLAPETEVIIVTAYADLRLAVQCLRAGAFDLLQKPVNAYDLLATVSRALERHELRAAAALYRAGQALFSARELDRLPQRIVDIACRLLRAEDVGLLLAGPDGRPAVVRALGGVPEADRLALAARLEGAVEVALASGPAHAARPLAGLAGCVGLTGIARGEVAQEQALAILDEVGLKDRAGEWPYVLSGGQKQRVALARALVAHPQILALDEPLGALDALTRIEMQLLLERIWRKQKFTAVLVTHDVYEAVALADRIVVIDEGRIALDLDVKLPRPRRHGTAEFARLEEQVLNQLFGRGDTNA